jgi:hypothetical protein
MLGAPNFMKATTIPAGVLALLVIGTVACGTTASRQPASGNTAGNFSSNQPVSGPLIGYIWDQSAAGLRPIFGITGAASLGTALYTGRGYSGAAVSLRRQYALFTNTKGQVALATLPTGEPMQLLDRLSAKQQATVSPTGNAALVYASDLSTLILVQGLPAAPELQTINLPASVIANAAIVADSGLMLIATTQPDGTTSIKSLTPSGGSFQILTVSQLGGFAFLPHSDSALIADAGQNSVLLASRLGETPSISQIAGSGDGIAQPLAVAASSDGRWAVIANRQPSTIVKVDLTSRTPADKLQCGCSPAVLMSLAGNSVFVLTKLSAESMSVFDGDAAKPRILFIPGLQQTGVQGMLR